MAERSPRMEKIHVKKYFSKEYNAAKEGLNFIQQILQNDALTMKEAFSPDCLHLLNLVNVLFPCEFNEIVNTTDMEKQQNLNLKAYLTNLQSTKYRINDFPIEQYLSSNRSAIKQMVLTVLYLKSEYEQNGIQPIYNPEKRTFYLYKELFDSESNKDTTSETKGLNPFLTNQKNIDLISHSKSILIQNIFWQRKKVQSQFCQKRKSELENTIMRNYHKKQKQKEKYFSKSRHYGKGIQRSKRKYLYSSGTSLYLNSSFSSGSSSDGYNNNYSSEGHSGKIYTGKVQNRVHPKKFKFDSSSSDFSSYSIFSHSSDSSSSHSSNYYSETSSFNDPRDDYYGNQKRKFKAKKAHHHKPTSSDSFKIKYGSKYQKRNSATKKSRQYKNKSEMGANYQKKVHYKTDPIKRKSPNVGSGNYKTRRDQGNNNRDSNGKVIIPRQTLMRKPYTLSEYEGSHSVIPFPLDKNNLYLKNNLEKIFFNNIEKNPQECGYLHLIFHILNNLDNWKSNDKRQSIFFSKKFGFGQFRTICKRAYKEALELGNKGHASFNVQMTKRNWENYHNGKIELTNKYLNLILDKQEKQLFHQPFAGYAIEILLKKESLNEISLKYLEKENLQFKIKFENEIEAIYGIITLIHFFKCSNFRRGFKNKPNLESQSQSKTLNNMRTKKTTKRKTPKESDEIEETDETGEYEEKKTKKTNKEKKTNKTKKKKKTSTKKKKRKKIQKG